MIRILYTGTLDLSSIQAELKACDVVIDPIRFIETVGIDPDYNHMEFDWVFFNSKESAKYFFQHFDEPPQVKYAAVGQGTADVASKHVPISFIGKNADTEAVGREFAEVVGTSVVLFPISSISKRTVQRALPSKQCIDFTCYHTSPIARKVEHYHTAIFSSPSNIDGFLIENKNRQVENVICYGATTAHRALKAGFSGIYTLKEITPSSILRAIKETIAC